MSRWIRGEIVLGFMFASLFWVCVLGWQSAYAPSEIEKKHCYDEAKKSGHKNDECKTIWERTTTDPVALFTLVLAFSTVGLWTATIGLYRAGERQIKLTHDIFVASNRPWVAVTNIDVGDIVIAHGGVSTRFILCVVNKGSMPAVRCSSYEKLIAIGDTANIRDIENHITVESIKQYRSIGFSLFPEQKNEFRISISILTEEMEEAVSSSKYGLINHLMLIGNVIYEFPYDKEIHLTPFAFNITRKGSPIDFRKTETIKPDRFLVYDSSFVCEKSATLARQQASSRSPGPSSLIPFRMSGIRRALGR